MGRILWSFIFATSLPLMSALVSAEMLDTVQQKNARPLAGSPAMTEENMTEDYLFPEENDEEMLEHANFTPSKHKKTPQKSDDKLHKKKKSQKIHQEGEDLQRMALKEKPVTTRKPNVKALDILYNEPQEGLQIDDIQKMPEGEAPIDIVA